MSALLRWCGLPLTSAELTPAQEGELLAVLIRGAELARWAGVVPDWGEASELERVAWSTAGRRVELQKAKWIGQAAQGPRAAAAVAAELDEGEAHDELLLLEAMHVARAALEARREP